MTEGEVRRGRPGGLRLVLLRFVLLLLVALPAALVGRQSLNERLGGDPRWPPPGESP